MSLLEVGRIVRPHGIKGEVVVELVSNVPGRLVPGAIFAARTAKGSRPPLEVLEARPHQHRHLVAFSGFDDRNAAETLRDVVLLAEPDDAGDELLVHELIGKSVVDQHGVERGEVVAVEANPASDLLVLAGGALVPLRFVTSISGQTIAVEVPEGLFD